jgi:hypothetical protein
VEVVEMRIVVPAGQSLPRVSASVSMSREEAIELREALDLVQAKGSSGWTVNIVWSEIEASITLMMELDVPHNHLNSV